MSDEANRTGQISSTPEGGPIDAGVPASEPGAGQVRSTPEAAPLGDDDVLTPPTWQEHMDGPILGMDDAPPPPAAGQESAGTSEAASQSSDWKGVPTTSVASSERAAEEELRKWPPYTGKPVSAAGWDALRYAAPIVSQAEKLAIKAIGLSGRGLSKLAQYLEARRLEREEANRRNLRLWETEVGDQPMLAAWAIFTRIEGSFDLFVHPELHGTPAHEAVMDEYVVWAEARAREAGLKQIMPWWAMAYDKILIRMMQARGFVEPATDGLPAPLFERTLDELPAIQLPEGFSVQGVSTLNEGRLRAHVTHGTFSSSDDWESYAAAYAQFISSPVYDGERDLFVRSPDGRGASACTIWFDPVNAVGLFEPVGTHPDFRGMGLGKAVMAEALRRMKAAGMRRATVGFDPNNAAALALYTSLGFKASSYFTFPIKALA